MFQLTDVHYNNLRQTNGQKSTTTRKTSTTTGETSTTSNNRFLLEKDFRKIPFCDYYIYLHL